MCVAKLMCSKSANTLDLNCLQMSLIFFLLNKITTALLNCIELNVLKKYIFLFLQDVHLNVDLPFRFIARMRATKTDCLFSRNITRCVCEWSQYWGRFQSYPIKQKTWSTHQFSWLFVSWTGKWQMFLCLIVWAAFPIYIRHLHFAEQANMQPIFLNITSIWFKLIMEREKPTDDFWTVFFLLEETCLLTQTRRSELVMTVRTSLYL